MGSEMCIRDRVGLGTHDQLRQSCPVYEEIYESQFKKGDVQK